MPTPTTTRLGTVCPAAQLRFDASGRVSPAGQTVRKPAPTVFVTVTFSATADAFAGTLPPVTVRLSDPPAASRCPLFLLSSRRDGAKAL